MPDPTPSPESTAPPTTAAAASPRRARRSTAPRGSRWGLWLFLAVAFVGTAIAFSGMPEKVTHGEALDVAAALENATTIENIRSRFHVVLPAGAADAATTNDSSAGFAEVIAALKEVGTYTFVFVGFDAKGNRTLLFRVHKSTRLFDYHRLRLERRDGKPRITDIQVVSLGDWLHSMLGNADNAAHSATILQAMQSIRYPKGVRIPPDGVSAETRRTLPFAAMHLWWLVDNDKAAFPAALTEFRTAHPRNCAVDLVVATRWLTLGLDRELAVEALHRIEEGVGDPDYMQQLRERVMN